MPIARTTDLLAHVRTAVQLEAQQAAGNDVLSRAEQAALPAGLLRESAEELRAAGMQRVGVTALTDRMSARIAAVLGQVNQASGPGANSVSQAEVRAAAALAPEVGVRLARAYELITGARVELPGSAPPAPSPPPVTPPAPGTITFENATITAAEATALLDLVNTASQRTLDRDVGLDARAVASILSHRPIADLAALEALPWIAAQAAGRMISYLQRAPSPPPAPPPAPPAPAPGLQPIYVAPRSAATLAGLKQLLRAADHNRDGKLSYGEAKHFGESFQNTSAIGFDDPRNWAGAARALWEARLSARAATGSDSPTLADIDAVLDATEARTRAFYQDAQGYLCDGQGQHMVGVASALDYHFAASAIEGLDPLAEPWVRTVDHEGDQPVARRLPLDLSGSADQAIRRLVFHFNEAGNDNHWPRWSGRVTSRYKLGPTEAQHVADAIRAEPAARGKELLQALERWIQQGSAGLAYLEPNARPILEQLATSLGVTVNLTGPTRAPVLHI